MKNDTSEPPKDDLSQVIKLLYEIERKQAVMQSDVQKIKSQTTMNELRAGNTESLLKEQAGRLRMIEEDLAGMHDDVSGIAISQESIETNIEQILEALTPEVEKITENTLRLNDHDSTLKQHTIRLTALENAT